MRSRRSFSRHFFLNWYSVLHFNEQLHEFDAYEPSTSHQNCRLCLLPPQLQVPSASLLWNHRALILFQIDGPLVTCSGFKYALRVCISSPMVNAFVLGTMRAALISGIKWLLSQHLRAANREDETVVFCVWLLLLFKKGAIHGVGF